MNKPLELNHRWTVTLEEDPETGETLLPLPPELLALEGWEEGTILEWIEQEDGSVIIQKVKDGR